MTSFMMEGRHLWLDTMSTVAFQWRNRHVGWRLLHERWYTRTIAGRDKEEDEVDDNDADDGGVSTGRQLTQDDEGWAARTGSRLPVATRPIAAVSAVRW